MRDLINKLNEIETTAIVNEDMIDLFKSSNFKKVGEATIGADSTDEELLEAVEALFSNWNSND